MCAINTIRRHVIITCASYTLHFKDYNQSLVEVNRTHRRLQTPDTDFETTKTRTRRHGLPNDTDSETIRTFSADLTVAKVLDLNIPVLHLVTES